jgi:hypothetical protein
MKNAISGLVLLSALLSVSPAMAQQKRASPHETISSNVDGDRVTIVYGRPYTKNPRTGEVRKIWGGLVPWGQVWRTGADEATLLILQKPIMIGGATVPAGAYTLWTIPNQDGSAQLAINRQIGQWGQDRDPKNIYDQSQDVARVALKKESPSAPADQFTMAITKSPSGGGAISMTWENTEYTVPFMVSK